MSVQEVDLPVNSTVGGYLIATVGQITYVGIGLGLSIILILIIFVILAILYSRKLNNFKMMLNKLHLKYKNLNNNRRENATHANVSFEPDKHFK